MEYVCVPGTILSPGDATDVNMMSHAYILVQEDK